MNTFTSTEARCLRNVCALYRRRVREACAQGDLSSAKFWRLKAGEWAAKARTGAAALGAVVILAGCAQHPTHASSADGLPWTCSATNAEEAISNPSCMSEAEVQGPPGPEREVQTEEPCGRACRFWAFSERHPFLSLTAGVVVLGAIAALSRDTNRCLNGGHAVTVAVPTFSCDGTTCTEGPTTTREECR